jgi:hypothetical protein
MRFEIEAHAIEADTGNPFSDCAMTVAWRYSMTFREVIFYFSAVEGLRLAH